jgi:hypothetical protein
LDDVRHERELAQPRHTETVIRGRWTVGGRLATRRLPRSVAVWLVDIVKRG